MNKKYKEWIDEATYLELLRRWRNTPVGEPIFQQTETTLYYSKVMAEKKAVLPAAEAIAISKRIGWDKDACRL